MKHLLMSLFVIVLIVAACGGDDDTAADAGDTVVTMTEFAFEPADLAMVAGTEARFAIENAGSITHDWIVVQPGHEVETEDAIPDDMGDDFSILSVELAAGQAYTTNLTIDEPGTYQIICAVPGHFTAGMAGELVVTQ